MHLCIHLTLISYYHKSSKYLNIVSIWFFDEFSSLYLRFLNIKPISYLTMVCYHQNLIRRTLGLTILIIIKQSYQKKHSYRTRRLAYLSYMAKRFHENIEVSLTNIAYNMHSIYSNNQAIKTISYIRKLTNKVYIFTKFKK